MVRADGRVHVDVVEIVAQNDRAFLCEIAGAVDSYWIAKSDILNPENYKSGDRNVTISVPAEVAAKFGFKDCGRF